MAKMIHGLKLNETTENRGTGTFVTTDFQGWMAYDVHHEFSYDRRGNVVGLVVDGRKRPNQILKNPEVETGEAVEQALESFYRTTRSKPVRIPITESARREKQLNQTTG